MIQKVFKKVKCNVVLLAALTLSSVVLVGCGSGGGSDSYDAPDATVTAPLTGQTENVLIDAAQLKSWVDSGLVNDETSYEKVVILTVTSEEKYIAGHIPGSQLWDKSEHVMTRTEGPLETVNLVLDGPSMDAMLQKHGINSSTTVVITSADGDANYFPSRAYFLLRYWGFPKERLKVLNGFNNAWAADYALTTVVPDIDESDFSVQDLDEFRPDLRASLSETIDAVREQTALVVDFRSDAMPAATNGVFADDHDGDDVESTSGGDADVVVFEGTMKGGEYFAFGNLTNLDGTFKDAAVMAGELDAAGIDNAQPIITMCRTGYIASTGFMALDAVLGWDVMAYDGSWSQWGSLSTAATAKGGLLPNDTLWATDTAELMDVIVYNDDAGKNIEPARVDLLSPTTYLSPSDEGANNIEDEDREYFESGAGDSGAPPSIGGGGGGC